MSKSIQRKNALIKKVNELLNIMSSSGVANTDYLTQLIYLLFLKMEHEKVINTGKASNIKPGFGWADLLNESGTDLIRHYERTLQELSKEKGLVGAIFMKAVNKIDSPVNLEKLISFIDKENWFVMEDDFKGALYESILQKNGQRQQGGAGQYFTPRPLVDTIVKVVNPQIGETITDPACGTGGFLLSAYNFMKGQSKVKEKLDFLNKHTFTGNDITPLVVTMGSMNMYLHNIGGTSVPIQCKDSLLEQPERLVKIVLANPPFGARPAGTIDINRNDFIKKTKNNQLNFVQHIMSQLMRGGRAGVVLPDNVLFDSEGKEIRHKLLTEFNLHTILRLPSGLFYAQGVQANVLFFTKGEPTENVWYYDYRTNVKHTLKQNPLRHEDLNDFVKCFNTSDLSKRQETYDKQANSNGRWRKFPIEELLKRDLLNLDITWISETQSEEDTLSIDELLVQMEERVQTIQIAFDKLKEELSDEL